jgi:chemotaxis methyl-accepting protein methylase
VAFTYFSEAVQRYVLDRIAERLRADGFLVIGRHESLPTNVPSFEATGTLGMYRKKSVGVIASAPQSRMGY